MTHCHVFCHVYLLRTHRDIIWTKTLLYIFLPIKNQRHTKTSLVHRQTHRHQILHRHTSASFVHTLYLSDTDKHIAIIFLIDNDTLPLPYLSDKDTSPYMSFKDIPPRVIWRQTNTLIHMCGVAHSGHHSYVWRMGWLRLVGSLK